MATAARASPRAPRQVTTAIRAAACSSSCGEHTVYCSDSDRSTCEKTVFKASVPENLSGELEAACNRLRAVVESCGHRAIDPEACHQFARFERSEHAAVYDCLAKQGCEADPNACSLAPTTLGDELCGGGGRCTGLCNAKKQDALNAEGAWLRSDVQEAGRSCLRYESCDDVAACLGAWSTASVLRGGLNLSKIVVSPATAPVPTA